jgi:3-oxoacyl-[acyl-carrier protein] reductase
VTSDSQGRTALVTGAGRGIGNAIAHALLGPGLTLVATMRQPGASLLALEEACTRAGTKLVPLHLDITDAEAVTTLVGNFLESNPVDILVNNAAITHDGLALRLSDGDYQKVWETDFLAAVRLTRMCLRGMVKRRYGRIVQVSSIVAKHGNAGQSAYAAAKAGLEAYTKSVAKEVASRGVTVNAIAPGFIATDMTASMKPEWKETIKKEIPLRRLGEPAEVAEVVRFLASEESGYITGQVVEVAGGLLG